jgi:hypothetical protein
VVLIGLAVGAPCERVEGGAVDAVVVAVEAHELGLADEVEGVVAGHHVGDLRSVCSGELFGGPLGQEVVLGHLRHARLVGGELHKVINVDLRGLEVAYVEDPVLARVVVVGLGHLFADERGRRGREPEVVVRRAPVGDVVVDAGAAGAGLFGRARQLADVAVVVVGPAERDVVGDLHADAVEIEALLI